MARARRPRFTLRTYVRLQDEGVGDAAFMDVAVGAVSEPRKSEGVNALNR